MLLWLFIVAVILIFLICGSGRRKRRQLYDAALKPDNWGNLMPWRPEIGGDGGYWVTSVILAIGFIVALICII